MAIKVAFLLDNYDIISDVRKKIKPKITDCQNFFEKSLFGIAPQSGVL